MKPDCSNRTPLDSHYIVIMTEGEDMFLITENNHDRDTQCDDKVRLHSSASSIASIKQHSLFTLKNMIIPSMNNIQSEEDSEEDKSIVIPNVISFISPSIQDDNAHFNDSFSLDSNPDICSTDIDVLTESSKEGIDSDVSQHPVPKKLLLTSEYQDDQSPTENIEVTYIIKPLETNDYRAHDDECDSFTSFRLKYLIVHSAIMLADGLQGTHLYILYEGYGYSAASLYSLGFLSGALTSAFTGPIVDKIGRKRSAMIYCFLEVMINHLEQYPILAGLALSRIFGGITTNLLHSVFESWLVTEHRRKGYAEEKLELILRDSTIVSNSAAIISGYIAHCLAIHFGPVGCFEGAVVLTAIALVLVALLWSENYGTTLVSSKRSWRGNMSKFYSIIAWIRFYLKTEQLTSLLSEISISILSLCISHYNCKLNNFTNWYYSGTY